MRPLSKILLLVVAMQMVSGFKMRCWLFCTDQTGIQTDYKYDRDTCREYAQLRIETDTANPQLMDGKDRSAQLVALFSACMADKGWTVPDGKGGAGNPGAAPMAAPATATAPATPASSSRTPIAANPAGSVAARPAPTPLPIVTQAEADRMAEERTEKSYLSRQSECAFARHSAEYSTVAATRAQACDTECATRRKQNPKGKKPAACP